ncbi:collagen alpha-1(III) chain-like [Lemur catta]|uniref:collagen alpha-1(III) chain-like n=1 Tax=Lemur catta TaxID=9447 RepID=UPI001E26AE88|nr:collagen alpha-1(III) chain-like [Lemur catta]
MMQGTLEPGGPLWGWDGDSDDDWDSAVLALLALAVVAATALALRWFGSEQDQEAAGPASTAPGDQPPQAGGGVPALHPKSKVSGGSKGQNSGQEKPDLPGRGPGSPAAAGGRGLAATARLPLKTAGEVPSRGARGQQHGNGTSAGKGKEPPRPGTAFLGRSKAGGTSAPLLIHFTPRSPGSDAEVQAEAGGGGVKGPARQAPVHTEQQDTGPWQPGAGPSGSLGRGRGGRRGPMDRARRPPKPGAAASAWDAVDAAAAGLCAGSPLPPGAQSVRAPEAGWPWARREVLVTQTFSQVPGSAGQWPGATGVCAGEARTEGSPGDHPFLGPGPGGTETRGDHSVREGRGSWREAYGRVPDLGSKRPPEEAKPAGFRSSPAWSPSVTPPPRGPEPRPPSASPLAAPLARVLLRVKISE